MPTKREGSSPFPRTISFHRWVAASSSARPNKDRFGFSMTFHREADTRRHRRPGRFRRLTNPEGIPYGSPGLVRSGGPTLGTGIGSAQPCSNPLHAVGSISCHPRVGGAPGSATRPGRPWHAYARSQCNGLRRDCVWPRLFPGKAAQPRPASSAVCAWRDCSTVIP